MTHTPQFGSQIAKNGFKNERDVIDKFNNWQNDLDVQDWLVEMGYDLKKIESIEAISGAEAKRRLITQGRKFDDGNVKTDVSVQVAIYLKSLVEPQNISVKLVSSNAGFNQIDKRKVDRYKAMWDIPDNITNTLKYFTGEQAPYKNVQDKRRMTLLEMEDSKVNELLDFLEMNKVLIISDVLKGRGILSAEWMLVARNKIEDNVITTQWTFQSINKVINYYSQGNVKVSPKGSIIIGRLSVQRKGGDNGRESAKLLQFKFNPLELLHL